ncbi:MAG: hypothetical protein JWP17_169, partial [Solirubrobacterales bacterium]|nr:hypothetical protein [Solirubrobacterales bacterium]
GGADVWISVPSCAEARTAAADDALAAALPPGREDL